MRTTRRYRLFPSITVVIAILAFTANANATVELRDEDTSNHCSEVQTNGTNTVTGGCEISIATEAGETADFAQHTPTGETTFSQCTQTLRMRFHETGHGLAYDQVFAGASCGRIPCHQSGSKRPWPTFIWEHQPNSEYLTTSLCIQLPSGTSSWCTVSIPITMQDFPTHSYEVRAAAAPSPALDPVRCAEVSGVSLVGHWITSDGATGSDMETAH